MSPRASAPLLLIGAGRMGGALLKGWLARGVKSIIVVEPKPSAELRRLARGKKIALFFHVYSFLLWQTWSDNALC